LSNALLIKSQKSVANRNASQKILDRPMTIQKDSQNRSSEKHPENTGNSEFQRHTTQTGAIYDMLSMREFDVHPMDRAPVI